MEKIKVYGSTASPYVRRVRILFDKDSDFSEMTIFEKKEREFLKKHNPSLKIPFIRDGETTLFDSQLIWEYYNKKKNWIELNLDQMKYLKIINEANNAGVILLMRKRMNEDPEQNGRYSLLQKERIETCLSYLEENIHIAEIWNPIGTWLFCLLDWFDFREIYPFKSFERLSSFWKKNQERDDVQSSNPRN